MRAFDCAGFFSKADDGGSLLLNRFQVFAEFDPEGIGEPRSSTACESEIFILVVIADQEGAEPATRFRFCESADNEFFCLQLL